MPFQCLSNILVLFVVLFIVQAVVVGSALPPQIPSLASFTSSNAAPFTLSPSTQLIVDSKFASYGHPSLHQLASTFHSDLVDVTGFSSLPPVAIAPSSQSTATHISSIFLTLNTTANFTLYNGDPTDEGYQFIISENVYLISGAAPIGTWWGTRSLLQQVALLQSENDISSLKNSARISIPSGSGYDSPGWEIRGFMLDAGRHFYEPNFLADLCIYASFFKINEFHIHASDNLWDPAYLNGPDWRDLYTGFRFRPPSSSEVDGLVPTDFLNETWSQAAFANLQTTCAQHGVKLVPEIDTPGHSLVISKWKPQLAIEGEPDDLNLTYPETIPTIKSIWETFLPWFESQEVSIGADEYESSLADDYISFVNEMSGFFSERNKSMRVWGTYEPSSTESISKNVTIQHWAFPDEDIPIQLLDAGYRVINSEQAFLYLEGKVSEESGFPQTLSPSLLFSGAPNGAGWAPNIFSASDASNNTSPFSPGLRGAIFPLWNDWGPNSSTQLEIYYQLSQSMALFAEKTWAGSGVRKTQLTLDEFEEAYGTLNAKAPGQNLNRVVQPANGDQVFSYPTVPGPQKTGYESVGPPYTLSFVIHPSEAYDPAELTPIFSGGDSALYLQNLTFSSLGRYYPLGLSESIPVGKDTVVSIHATREYTYAVVGGKTLWWTASLDIWGDYTALANMSFAAPSQLVGSAAFRGTLTHVTLTLGI